MADKTKENAIDNRTQHENTLTFEERVVKKIAGIAASEIPGILAMSGNVIAGLTDKIKNSEDPTRGITVELGKKQVAIDMKVICEYGQNMALVFEQIVDKVSKAVSKGTNFDTTKPRYKIIAHKYANSNNTKREAKRLNA